MRTEWKKKNSFRSSIHTTNCLDYVSSAFHFWPCRSAAAHLSFWRAHTECSRRSAKETGSVRFVSLEKCAKNCICLIFSIASVCIVLLPFTLEKSPTTQSKWNCILPDSGGDDGDDCKKQLIRRYFSSVHTVNKSSNSTTKHCNFIVAFRQRTQKKRRK